MSDTLLAISSLSIERGERLLFAGYDLAISSGEIVQIGGGNGVGKTSLLRSAAGLLSVSTGEFSWRGQSVDNASMYSDEILYLGHKAAVRDQLTPLENLQWYAQLLSQQTKVVGDKTVGDGLVGDDELLDALYSLGLRGYENDLCSTLSAGQKRRVGLARMAISSASLWILDEPFTAVDVHGVKTLITWIENYVSEGGAVFFTTHQAVNFRHRYPRVIDLDASANSIQGLS